jgi:hypothetical protein
MFRVIGRDAQGKSQELSVVAATEEEARAMAQGAGLVTIDRVGAPPAARPSRLPKLSGFTAGLLSCLACVACVVLGAMIGGLIARNSYHAPAENEAAVRQLFPSLAAAAEMDSLFKGVVGGALVGLICGVAILVACYRSYRARR